MLLLFPRLETFERLYVSHQLCLLIPVSMTTPRAVHPMSNNNCIIYLKAAKRVDLTLYLFFSYVVSYHKKINNYKEGMRKLWEETSMSRALMVWWVYTYSQMPQLYTINTYSFLHVNHTSIKWFLKREPLPNSTLRLKKIFHLKTLVWTQFSDCL